MVKLFTDESAVPHRVGDSFGINVRCEAGESIDVGARLVVGNPTALQVSAAESSTLPSWNVRALLSGTHRIALVTVAGRTLCSKTVRVFGVEDDLAEEIAWMLCSQLYSINRVHAEAYLHTLLDEIESVTLCRRFMQQLLEHPIVAEFITEEVAAGGLARHHALLCASKVLGSVPLPHYAILHDTEKLLRMSLASAHVACRDKHATVVVALKFGKSKFVSELITRGYCHATWCGEDPLHCAIMLQQVDVVRDLLVAGCDPNSYRGGKTPLRRCVDVSHRASRLAIMALLLATNKVVFSPLLSTSERCVSSNLSVLQLVIEQGWPAESHLILQYTARGLGESCVTAIRSIIVSKKMSERSKIRLLEAVCIYNENLHVARLPLETKSVLSLAAEQKNMSVVAWLLNDDPGAIAAKEVNGDSSFHGICRCVKDTQAADVFVSLLTELSGKMSVSMKDALTCRDQEGNTPLHLLCRSLPGSVRAVRELIGLLTLQNVWALSATGETPLYTGLSCEMERGVTAELIELFLPDQPSAFSSLWPNLLAETVKGDSLLGVCVRKSLLPVIERVVRVVPRQPTDNASMLATLQTAVISESLSEECRESICCALSCIVDFGGSRNDTLSAELLRRAVIDGMPKLVRALVTSARACPDALDEHGNPALANILQCLHAQPLCKLGVSKALLELCDCGASLDWSWSAAIDPFPHRAWNMLQLACLSGEALVVDAVLSRTLLKFPSIAHRRYTVGEETPFILFVQQYCSRHPSAEPGGDEYLRAEPIAGKLMHSALNGLQSASVMYDLLVHAIIFGSLPILKEALSHPQAAEATAAVHPVWGNLCQYSLQSPDLLLCANQQRHEICSAILHTARNIPIDAVSNQGGTVMHMAIRSGWSAGVKLLIACGASVNARDANGVPPISYLVEHASEIGPVSSELLSVLASTGCVDLNIMQRASGNLFIRALQAKNLLLLRRIIEYGFAQKGLMDTTSLLREFILSAAKSPGTYTQQEIKEAMLMIQCTANVDTVEELAKTDPEGYTVMMHAAEAADAALIISLFQSRARCECMTNKGENLLHLVMRTKEDPPPESRIVEVVRAIMLRAPQISTVQCDDAGYTPLHIAADRGLIAALYAMLTESRDYRNVDVNLLDPSGRTFLQILFQRFVGGGTVCTATIQHVLTDLVQFCVDHGLHLLSGSRPTLIELLLRSPQPFLISLAEKVLNANSITSQLADFFRVEMDGQHIACYVCKLLKASSSHESIDNVDAERAERRRVLTSLLCCILSYGSCSLARVGSSLFGDALLLEEPAVVDALLRRRVFSPEHWLQSVDDILQKRPEAQKPEDATLLAVLTIARSDVFSLGVDEACQLAVNISRAPTATLFPVLPCLLRMLKRAKVDIPARLRTRSGQGLVSSCVISHMATLVRCVCSECPELACQVDDGTLHTPLHVAMRLRQGPAVKALLDVKVNLEAKSSKGITALQSLLLGTADSEEAMLPADTSEEDTVVLSLLEHICSTSTTTDLRQVTSNGDTLLSLALRKRLVQAASFLHSRGLALHDSDWKHVVSLCDSHEAAMVRMVEAHSKTLSEKSWRLPRWKSSDLPQRDVSLPVALCCAGAALVVGVLLRDPLSASATVTELTLCDDALPLHDLLRHTPAKIEAAAVVCEVLGAATSLATQIARRDAQGNTLLHIAAMQGYVSILQYVGEALMSASLLTNACLQVNENHETIATCVFHIVEGEKPSPDAAGNLASTMEAVLALFRSQRELDALLTTRRTSDQADTIQLCCLHGLCHILPDLLNQISRSLITKEYGLSLLQWTARGDCSADARTSLLLSIAACVPPSVTASIELSHFMFAPKEALIRELLCAHRPSDVAALLASRTFLLPRYTAAQRWCLLPYEDREYLASLGLKPQCTAATNAFSKAEQENHSLFVTALRNQGVQWRWLNSRVAHESDDTSLEDSLARTLSWQDVTDLLNDMGAIRDRVLASSPELSFIYYTEMERKVAKEAEGLHSYTQPAQMGTKDPSSERTVVKTVADIPTVPSRLQESAVGRTALPQREKTSKFFDSFGVSCMPALLRLYYYRRFRYADHFIQALLCDVSDDHLVTWCAACYFLHRDAPALMYRTIPRLVGLGADQLRPLSAALAASASSQALEWALRDGIIIADAAFSDLIVNRNGSTPDERSHMIQLLLDNRIPIGPAALDCAIRHGYRHATTSLGDNLLHLVALSDAHFADGPIKAEKYDPFEEAKEQNVDSQPNVFGRVATDYVGTSVSDRNAIITTLQREGKREEDYRALARAYLASTVRAPQMTVEPVPLSERARLDAALRLRTTSGGC